MNEDSYAVDGARQTLFILSIEEVSQSGSDYCLPTHSNVQPVLQEMLALWVDEIIALGGKIPVMTSFDPLEHPEMIPHFFRLIGGPDPELLTMKFNGNRVYDLIDRDVTGQKMRDLYEPEHWSPLRDMYRHVFESNSAIGIRSNLHLANRTHVEVQTAILPFRHSDEDVIATDILGVTISTRS